MHEFVYCYMQVEDTEMREEKDASEPQPQTVAPKAKDTTQKSAAKKVL